MKRTSNSEHIETSIDRVKDNLSPSQKQLFFYEQLHPNTNVYSIPIAYQITGDLDYQLLQQSIRQVVTRHNALRTSICMNDTIPNQVVNDINKFKINNYDLSELPKSQAFEKANELLNEEVNRPFKIVDELLFRCTIIAIEAQKYYLIFNAHHIIFDGISAAILINELTSRYDEAIKGSEPTFEEFPESFGNYNELLNQKLELGNLEKSKNYWFDELQGELPFLEVDRDYYPTDELTYHGDNFRKVVDQTLSDKLFSFCGKYGVTPQMMILSAIFIFLYKYTGQNDLIIGTPLSGRMSKTFQEQIGFFVNMLPIRNKLDVKNTFESVLSKVKEKSIQSFIHQEYPFSKIIEDVNPPRSGTLSPIFQTTFTYQYKTNPQMMNCEFEALDFNYDKVKYDLAFSISEGEGKELELRIDFRTELYSVETIEYMAKNFEKLLWSIVEKPNATIDELELLTHSLDTANLQEEKAIKYKGFDTVHKIFEKQAEALPNKIAIEFEEKFLTYQELNQKANKVAHWLLKKGVKVGSPVVIYFDKSIEAIIAMLAILKAGGAYMPINPEAPLHQMKLMVENTNARFFLSQQKYANIFVEFNGIGTFIDKNDVWKMLDKESTKNLTLELTGENLINILHTSGSTGVPKAVPLLQKGVLRLLADREFLTIDKQDGIIQASVLNFDGTTMDVWGTLCNGAKLIIIKKETLLSPVAIEQTIKEKGVTILLVVTQIFNRIVDECPEALRKLKSIGFGGEAASIKHVKKALNYCNSGVLINTYGPTESTYIASYYKIDALEDNIYSIPIGIPIKNTGMYVLDKTMKQVPDGVTGDLYLSGDGLAKGYLNNSQQTNASFFELNLANGETLVLYKTGDKARKLLNGNYEYRGREDNQVKIRGHRVELSAIENCIQEFTDIKNCIVIQNKKKSYQLIAYVVWDKKIVNELDQNKILQRFLKSHLADYMVPSYILSVSKIPLTTNNKIDFHSLPTPNEGIRKNDFDEPQDTVELFLLKLWREILDLSIIGTDENFFDIGGHSLLLYDLEVAINEKFGFKFGLANFFAYPTIEEMAKFIKAHNSEEKEGSRFETNNCSKNRLSEDDAVAVIGISLRFPKANTANEFWNNLLDGRDCISHFSEDEIEGYPLGKEPLQSQQWVKSSGVIENEFDFDPAFFGLTKHQSMKMDPQQRILLECVWEAIEDAGYKLEDVNDTTSLFLGAANSGYSSQFALGGSIADLFHTEIDSNNNFIPQQISYKLGLKGESIFLDTACSTSLVAIHMACQSLLSHQSDYSMAGGFSLTLPQCTGYVYEPGFIMSPDGKCRAFDKEANGTVEGNGGAVVLLKRLSDAKRDRDPIYAVICGSAVNNDGKNKIGFTAPGYLGQSQVIQKAIENAGISAEKISFVEAHGTGTKLGDPIEIAALTDVFRKYTDKTQFCAVGSVKSNIGHLNIAAGIAGFIKTVLAIKNRKIPATLHFSEENPEIDFKSSPFFVNDTLREWSSPELLTAGVSSFGIGGTNAHLILQEYDYRKE